MKELILNFSFKVKNWINKNKHMIIFVIAVILTIWGYDVADDLFGNIGVRVFFVITTGIAVIGIIYFSCKKK